MHALLCAALSASSFSPTSTVPRPTRSISREHFEFQMLYGVRRDLQRNLVRDGYKVRVYVPFGTEWYPYFMRRLAERPANVLFLAQNFFRS
jgi:proline dehydrogenase